MIPSIVWLTAEDSVRAEEQKPDTQVGYRATPKTAISENPVPFAPAFLSHKARNHMDKGQCLNRIERIVESAIQFLRQIQRQLLNQPESKKDQSLVLTDMNSS